MHFNSFCKQSLMAIAVLALCYSTADAQRTDYHYKRTNTPEGIATKDMIIYDWAGDGVQTLRGEHMLNLGKAIRKVKINYCCPIKLFEAKQN